MVVSVNLNEDNLTAKAPRSPRFTRNIPEYGDHLPGESSAMTILVFFLASSAPWRFQPSNLGSMADRAFRLSAGRVLVEH